MAPTGRRCIGSDRLARGASSNIAPSPNCKRRIYSPNLKKRNNQRMHYPTERDYSDSDRESEGFDELDRCATNYSPRRYNASDSFEPTHSFNNEDSHSPPRIWCEPRRMNRQKIDTNEIKVLRSRLYPDLGEFKDDSRRQGGPPSFILIAMICLVIASIFCFTYFLYNANILFRDTKIKPLAKISEEMKKNLKYLHSEMGQTKHFWTQVLAQFELLTEESPLHPAVLLAIVPIDSQKTAVCLSQRILEVISSSFDDAKYLSFDTQSHISENVTTLKHDLDQLLQGLSKSHAAAIYNLEKLTPEAVMIFHAYCDTENAPYKRTLILFTIGFDLHYSSVSTDRLDWMAYNHLIHLWTEKGKLRVDDAAAIISRIANAPVVFRPEGVDVIQRLCPY